MSNVTALQVQQMHKQIPDSDLADPIPTFISDAETWIKTRFALCGIDTSWTDANEPDLVKLLIKHTATWYELKKLYGSQVEEFHDWVRDFRSEPESMMDIICEKAKEKSELPSGLTYLTSDIYRSTTKGRKKIFTLQDEKDQQFHPEDDDKRYGEQ